MRDNEILTFTPCWSVRTPPARVYIHRQKQKNLLTKNKKENEGKAKAKQRQNVKESKRRGSGSSAERESHLIEKKKGSTFFSSAASSRENFLPLGITPTDSSRLVDIRRTID